MTIQTEQEPVRTARRVGLESPGIIAAFAIGETTAQLEHDRPTDELLACALDRVSLRVTDEEYAYVDRRGHLILQLSTRNSIRARRRVHGLIRALVSTPLTDDPNLHVDVGSAWTRLSGELFTDASRMKEVSDQAEQSLQYRDLVLRRASGRTRPRPSPAVLPLLVVLTMIISLGIPFGVLVTTYQNGTDISGWVYLGLVVVLLVMSLTQIAEGLSALRRVPLPPVPETAPPPATAIIAAYLPNEAATITETVLSVLSQDYPGPFQVILAYNTPSRLPIEDELETLARMDPRLELLRVEFSRSKADNVNAALALVRGEFIGIFDADHHPMAGAFRRAWRWFDTGVDVVQGHCVVRNGEESGIARLVAVEFEVIYAVSHPGRQRLHLFGIFGGSNGYWRTSTLRETRLRSQFLTEDIDSSIRAVRGGAQIVNDPGLVSRELAPETFKALWKQRMRWAQGWFEVSLRHGHSAVSNSRLGLRQRYGLWMLLGWRELFPWIASLMWPTLAFFIWRDSGLNLANAPAIFWLTTAFTLSTGPILILFAHRLGDPEIRKHTAWWWQYAAASVIIYAELKNVIVRVAQIRHVLGMDEWVVTPRGRVERAEGRQASSTD